MSDFGIWNDWMVRYQRFIDVLISPWKRLKRVGESRVVNSSFVWIFILPTITKWKEKETEKI
ncbi:MAG: hypothetical protein HOG49_42535 [Candidatus Scalindua sp.]|jgi:hypothetical protein|nr:hypothetical protein [Candidatus Scalindua sp.]